MNIAVFSRSIKSSAKAQVQYIHPKVWYNIRTAPYILWFIRLFGREFSAEKCFYLGRQPAFVNSTQVRLVGSFALIMFSWVICRSQSPSTCWLPSFLSMSFLRIWFFYQDICLPVNDLLYWYCELNFAVYHFGWKAFCSKKCYGSLTLVSFHFRKWIGEIIFTKML